MDFFNRLFGNMYSREEQPSIQFGRYSDAYKSTDRYDAWDQSLESFEEDKYRESFEKFFYYLLNEKEDNVRYEVQDGRINFTIYQGSKQIKGFIDGEEVKAEAKIAATNGLNIGFLRRMMERNFHLKYSRYALDEDDNLTIVFDSLLLDGSPYKLYFGLKEVAVNADKLDDILVNEFEVLQEVNTSHTQELPVAEKKVKIRFLRDRIQKALEYIDSGQLNMEQYPGGNAYVLLELMYKIDYLVAPEGPTMELLERTHREYFAKQDSPVLQKVMEIRKSLAEILEKSDEQLSDELYLVISTFGLTNPVDHNQVRSFIDGELSNMQWYEENDHPTVALAIPGYIVGFCLFNYALPLPVKVLFHLYYEIIESDYFRVLGFELPFVKEDGTISKRSVRREIVRLMDECGEQYTGLKPDYGILDFDSKAAFAKSFLLMVHKLEWEEEST